MSISTIEPPNYACPPTFPLRKLTVDEYHRLVAASLFDEDEPTELLDGWLAWKQPKTPRRCTAVALLADALNRRLDACWHLRHHSGITTQDSEPEPDLAVVEGDPREYSTHHPYPAQCALVIQISDGWADFDRHVKAPLYARAGIRNYWMVDLARSVIEVFALAAGDVEYSRAERFGIKDLIPLTIGGKTLPPIPIEEVLI